jgi:hypothetical protein
MISSQDGGSPMCNYHVSCSSLLPSWHWHLLSTTIDGHMSPTPVKSLWLWTYVGARNEDVLLALLTFSSTVYQLLRAVVKICTVTLTSMSCGNLWFHGRIGPCVSPPCTDMWPWLWNCSLAYNVYRHFPGMWIVCIDPCTLGPCVRADNIWHDYIWYDYIIFIRLDYCPLCLQGWRFAGDGKCLTIPQLEKDQSQKVSNQR